MCAICEYQHLSCVCQSLLDSPLSSAAFKGEDPAVLTVAKRKLF